ncbi:MAG TPA: DUF92 domain-containing protein [Nitrososphaerales archaeon]|nr:DUF92 domain-containing protein [Nitrososphaerales archaeon]
MTLVTVVVVVQFFVVLAFALAAVLLNTIDARGFLASTTVGFAVMYGGGISWFVIVAVFFSLGVVFTLYKYGYKRRLGSAQGKGGARNWPHILANGGLASIAAIWNLGNPGIVPAAIFLGAVSTSAADTVATELGLLSHSQPMLISHPSRAVPPGTSGGVTALGFVGATFASIVIGIMALALGILPHPYLILPVCVVGGVFGATFDSLVGATVQRKGYCVVCLKPTEALKHCGERTKATQGKWYIENNIVNVVSTIAGAAAAYATLLVLTPLI